MSPSPKMRKVMEDRMVTSYTTVSSRRAIEVVISFNVNIKHLNTTLHFTHTWLFRNGSKKATTELSGLVDLSCWNATPAQIWGLIISLYSAFNSAELKQAVGWPNNIILLSTKFTYFCFMFYVLCCIVCLLSVDLIWCRPWWWWAAWWRSARSGSRFPGARAAAGRSRSGPPRT